MSAPTRIRPTAVADYVALIERFAAVASYVTVNISSPNTPGLRNMQQAAVLDDLLARVIDARERVAPHAGPTPVLLKIAPDLSLPDLDDVVGIARSRRVDGMIVGNTTLARPPSLREVEIAKEAGGLSGRPLLPLANRMLAETYVRVEGVFPLIGAGGIDSGAAALGQNPRRREPRSALFGIGFLAVSALSPISSARWSPRSIAISHRASSIMSAPMRLPSPPSRGRTDIFAGLFALSKRFGQSRGNGG